MKIEIPYNMKFFINNELNETPENLEEMKKGVSWLKDKSEEVDQNDLGKKANLLSQLAGYARIIGDYSLSEESFNMTIKILEDLGNPELVFFNKLRMAVLYQNTKNLTKSSEIYLKAIKFIRGSKSKKVKNYLDFALHNYGKQLFEQKRYQEAMELFVEAHEVKIGKGDINSIKATELAMTLTKEILENEEEPTESE